jgi:hypothetical protein
MNEPQKGSGQLRGALVAAIALLALVAVVAVAIFQLPDDQKGQNIIAIASASFGVIGAIVGGYFGVSSANRAAEIVGTNVAKEHALEAERVHMREGGTSGPPAAPPAR